MPKLTVEQLKAYIKRAAELEVAVYTEKELARAYTVLAKAQMPQKYGRQPKAARGTAGPVHPVPYNEAAQAGHAARMRIYAEAARLYAMHRAEMMAEHAAALAALTQALEQHYAQNILCPKYREIVAVTSINEYLESGRCSALEGADGAYHLYESELRQNVIIGRLAEAVSNMERIRAGQYALYTELQRANHTVADILDEVRQMHSETKMMAYFAGVTALAATSPRVTVGMAY